ncbi:nitrite/sulfite reductase [Hydrogenimonas cancrithermarum]|uniref:Ferredoxin--nitrite reductase n=1 Tax=Hydrogenimonas cancrithermarum TaxID=2993563 RepID=A0ABM8FLL4_9BACT|nr:nitrite/sulfite reductase [Hydrogenimonas cancrithermarum]BDY13248.1 ferredoxin--nitrite reductase [Hydrogenimonas cancrithermarum]
MMMQPEHLTEKRYEKYKSALRPYDYFPEIETLDFESLAESDRVYLQDFGIFNSELEEEMFMLRVRVPGGRVGAENFKAIAELVEKHDLTLLLTARSGMQLHGIEPENVLELFNRINAMDGLSTWQTFGDNVRNIVTDPFDGRGRSCEIESYPIIQQLHGYFLKNPELVGMLPRRISIGITGMRENSWPLFSNDLFFGLAEREGEKGFNVYMGGKNTEVSKPADIFLPAEEVADFARAVVEAFNRYGLREKRMKSRLFHMIEHYGMEQVKAFIGEFYGKTWCPAGKSLLRKRHFSDFEPLSDGTYGYRYRTDYGLVTPQEIRAVSDYAAKYRADVRIGIDQQLYILGVPDKSVPFEVRDTSPTVVACAGSEYCPFSYWSIKEEAHYLPREELAEHDIKVGFSGCLKGCGRHKHADIGIVGLRNSKFGKNDRSARIFLGCEYTKGKRPAEVVFRTIPVGEMSTMVSLLVDEYKKSGADDFEAFTANVLNRFDESFVELFFLARRESGADIRLDPQQDPDTLLKQFGERYYVKIAEQDGFAKASDAIVKALWYAEEIAVVKHMDPSKRRSR